MLLWFIEIHGTPLFEPRLVQKSDDDFQNEILIFAREMSLEVVIWQNFHCEILAWSLQTSFILSQMIVWYTFGAKIWQWISKWNFNFFTWNESWRCNLTKKLLWDFGVKLSDIIYVKSNDCLNHFWCENLMMNFIKFRCQYRRYWTLGRRPRGSRHTMPFWIPEKLNSSSLLKTNNCFVFSHAPSLWFLIISLAIVCQVP